MNSYTFGIYGKYFQKLATKKEIIIDRIFQGGRSLQEIPKRK